MEEPPTDSEELSEAEREYEQAVESRNAWIKERDSRSARRQALVRDVFRESLPSAIGTVSGAGVIYLVAVLSGLLEGARAVDVVTSAMLLGGVVGAILAFRSIPADARPPEVMRAMEVEALGAENARLRKGSER